MTMTKTLALGSKHGKSFEWRPTNSVTWLKGECRTDFFATVIHQARQNDIPVLGLLRDGTAAPFFEPLPVGSKQKVGVSGCPLAQLPLQASAGAANSVAMRLQEIAGGSHDVNELVTRLLAHAIEKGARSIQTLCNLLDGKYSIVADEYEAIRQQIGSRILGCWSRNFQCLLEAGYEQLVPGISADELFQSSPVITVDMSTVPETLESWVAVQLVSAFSEINSNVPAMVIIDNISEVAGKRPLILNDRHLSPFRDFVTTLGAHVTLLAGISSPRNVSKYFVNDLPTFTNRQPDCSQLEKIIATKLSEKAFEAFQRMYNRKNEVFYLDDSGWSCFELDKIPDRTPIDCPNPPANKLFGGSDIFRRTWFHLKRAEELLHLAVENHLPIAGELADNVSALRDFLENEKGAFKKVVLACPECKGNLTERTSQRGKFLGCSNFPHCSFTAKNVDSLVTPNEHDDANRLIFGKRQKCGDYA